MEPTLSEKEGSGLSTGNLMESRTSHLDDLLSEQLTTAFQKQTWPVILHDVAKIVSEHAPIDLAYASARLPPQLRHILYEHLPDADAKSEFMINTDSSTRSAIFRFLNEGELRALIEQMSAEKAVPVLENLAERRYRRLLELLDPAKAARIREIKKHPRHTAGRLMSKEFFAFPMEARIGDAATFIHDHPGIDSTQSVFVLNKEGELQGYVPARNLIVNEHHLPLRQVMRPVLHKAYIDTSREEIVDLVERYKIAVLPVVDSQSRILGVITHEDVIEVVEDIADETLTSMAGTAEKVSEYESLTKRFFSRIPWLIVTLCAGLVNGSVMSFFESHQKGVLTFVLFFVPLVTGMSGNIGIQCSTVLVRSMAIGLLSAGNRKEAVKNELLIGLQIGVVFGIVSGAAIYLLDSFGLSTPGAGALAVGCIVAMGLFGACAAAVCIGVFSPFIFARLRIDPAIAAGPIITALNDFLSMTIYFLIAMGVGSLLFN